MTISKKTIALLMALVLVLGAGIGGTIAYLQAKTATVTNTFTVGDIGTLKLEETKTTSSGSTTLTATEGGENQTNDTFVIVPGVNLAKDPKVTYTADTTDEAVYVFVKITPKDNGWTNSGTKGSYNIAADTTAPATAALADALVFNVKTGEGGWTAVPNVTGVYYQAVAAGTSLTDAAVLAQDTNSGKEIIVSPNITKEQLRKVTAANLDLVFTAYAIQQAGFTDAAAAWTAVSAN